MRPGLKARFARRRKVQLIHEGWTGGAMRPLDIRAGDTVMVIAGSDKGKRGVVEKTLPAEQRLVVRGVNVAKRHTRAGARGNQQGGIVDFFAPIAYSNVLLVCNRCEKPTRIAHQADEDGRQVIHCKKCGERHLRSAL